MRFGRVADLAKEHFKWDGFNTPDQPIITATDACIFAEKAVEIETKYLQEQWVEAVANCAIVTRDRRELMELRDAVRQTLEENAHLADGDNCTLIRLKYALQPNTDSPER